jgi:hypothetical protein
MSCLLKSDSIKERKGTWGGLVAKVTMGRGVINRSARVKDLGAKVSVDVSAVVAAAVVVDDEICCDGDGFDGVDDGEEGDDDVYVRNKGAAGEGV